jgi:hypothetical protein
MGELGLCGVMCERNQVESDLVSSQFSWEVAVWAASRSGAEEWGLAVHAFLSAQPVLPC